LCYVYYQVLSWLARQATSVVVKLGDGRIKAADFATLRTATFTVTAPLNVRLLQLSDYSDHVPSLPEELRRPLVAQAAAQANFDPSDAMNMAHAQEYIAQMEAAGQQPLDLARHPLAVFLMSLLPWMNAGPGGAAGGVGGDGGDDGGEDFDEDAANEVAIAAAMAEDDDVDNNDGAPTAGGGGGGAPAERKQ
jgi:hypothetical protein